MLNPRLLAVVAACSFSLIACGHAPPRITPFPHGDAIELFDAPVHLGDNLYDDQAFSAGPATAARACSLVNMPRTADVYVQVREVRMSETLSNMLDVNGRKHPLPATLERYPDGQTSNAMSASPVQRIRLDQGPTEVCLVAGHRSTGDLDDFEVAGVTLFVEGIDPHEVGVRRGLMQGLPGSGGPPSMPWGAQQGWPQSSRRSVPVAWTFPWGAR